MTTAAPPAAAPAPMRAKVVGNAPAENPAGMSGSTAAGPLGAMAATRGRLQSLLDRTTTAAYSCVRAVAAVRQVPSK
jgi:hypothetical protein